MTTCYSCGKFTCTKLKSFNNLHMPNYQRTNHKTCQPIPKTLTLIATFFKLLGSQFENNRAICKCLTQPSLKWQALKVRQSFNFNMLFFLNTLGLKTTKQIGLFYLIKIFRKRYHIFKGGCLIFVFAEGGSSLQPSETKFDVSQVSYKPD